MKQKEVIKIQKLIRNQNNGNIEGFAKALIELIENTEKRKQMGALAKENVKRYLPDNVMPLWDALFQKLTKDKN